MNGAQTGGSILRLDHLSGCFIIRWWRRSLRHHEKVSRFYFQHTMERKLAIPMTLSYTRNSSSVRKLTKGMTYSLRCIGQSIAYVQSLKVASKQTSKNECLELDRGNGWGLLVGPLKLKFIFELSRIFHSLQLKWLIHSKDHSLSWEANSRRADQEIPRILNNPKI
jgi:hypothetical protein